MKKKIYTGDNAGIVKPFASAVVSEPFVFLSGINGGGGDVNKQTEGCLNNIDAALKRARTSLDNTIKMRIALRDTGEWPKVEPVLKKRLKMEEIAVMLVNAGSYFSETRIAIEVIAVLPGVAKKSYPFQYAGVRQPFAKSVVVEPFVFLSGMDGREMATGKVRSLDLADQLEVVMEKTKLSLEEAGTTVENVVWGWDYASKEGLVGRDEYGKEYGLTDWPQFDKAMRRYNLKPENIAATFIRTGLCQSDMVVSLELIATLPQVPKTTYPAYYGEVMQVWSLAVVVEPWVITSGAPGREDATGNVPSMNISEQTEVSFSTLRAALDAGGTSFDNVIKATVYTRDPAFWPEISQVMGKYLKLDQITGHVVHAGLFYKNMLEEIELVAVRPE